MASAVVQTEAAPIVALVVHRLCCTVLQPFGCNRQTIWQGATVNERTFSDFCTVDVHIVGVSRRAPLRCTVPDQVTGTRI
jgi:hypothetical protein